MVVYTLLKKHAFAVLKCQKNGPSDQSEMTQDQSWLQGAHVCLIGLIWPEAAYTTRYSVAFLEPMRVGAFDATIDDDDTAVVCARTEAVHKAKRVD